jgi:predicted small secreted protein
VYIKTSIATLLLLLCTALLMGCNVEYGTDSKAVQVTGDKGRTIHSRQDNASETTTINAAATIAQLREDLRLANERAKLAEEKAALEKQKREFAEARVRKFEKEGKADGDKKSSVDETISGS